MCLMFKEGIVKKAVKALPILWLVSGIVFACGSFYGYHLLKNADHNAEQRTHRVEPKETSQQRIEKRTREAIFDESQIKPVTPEAFARAQLSYEKITNQWGIGALYIPSAAIRTKILAGMDNQNLMVGVGTYSPTQQLGKGNYVVLAHNIVQGGGALGNLPKTALNQVFYATDFTNVYEYVARKNGIVDQSAGELLEGPEKGEDALMTLIRCEGGINTPNRAIVQGMFVKSYPAEEARTEVKLGLGLVEEREAETAQAPSAPRKRADFSKATGDHPTAKTEEQKPIYSVLQTFCINLFVVLSASPILLGGGYLVVLGAFFKAYASMD